MSYVEKAIKICQENEDFSILPHLFYTKGLCEFRLELESYKSSIEFAITLAKNSGKDKLAKMIEDKLAKYVPEAIKID